MEGVLEIVDRGDGRVDDRRVASAGQEGGDGISPAPQKMSRTDVFPFRMPPNGPTFYGSSNSECRRGNDLYDGSGDAASRSMQQQQQQQQPFPVSFRSPGMASLRFPFTATQWQELEQQALIFKHMMAAVPVPPDLLAPIRRSLANASSAYANGPANHLGWGGFGLRFSSATDPEPGRCRRTDGKKWRCSRDVAPDQKYCERHMHRGRPRSRKPVELQLQKNSNDSNTNDGALPNSSTAASALAISRPLPLAPTLLSSSASSCPLSSLISPFDPPTSDAFAKASWFKLPTQTVMASSLADKTSSYWMRGDVTGMVSTGRESTAASHQWQMMQVKLGRMQEDPPLKLTSNDTTASLLNCRDQLALIPEADVRSKAIQSGHGRTSIFTGNRISGIESANEQMQPRRFIDAWSRDETSCWLSKTTSETKSSNPNLALSPLSLSMSSSVGYAADEVNPIAIGSGIGASDITGGLKSAQPQTPSWMLPVSWQLSSSSPLGGPLAEVLQSSGGTAPTSPNGCGSKNSGGLTLLSDGWGESSPRLMSSPTGVLQKTLASLSDSSSGNSPTFDSKPEMALQWLNQQAAAKLPSSLEDPL